MRRAAIIAALVLLPVAASAQLQGLSLDWMTDQWRPLLASSGIVATPAGFDWAHGLSISQAGPSDFAVADDVSDYAPTGVTYYVGWPGASDSNDGLTTSTSLNTLTVALGKADVKVIRLFPKVHTRVRGTFPTGTSGKSVSIIAEGGTAVISAHDDLVWTLQTGSTYKATRSAAVSAWDASTLDASGDYARLTSRASIADVDGNPGSWFTDGTTVYVRTADSRAPDANVRVYLNVDNAKIDGAVTVYLEGIRFEGGKAPLKVLNTSSIAVPTVYAKNCEFKYSSLDDGVAVQGATTRFQGCTAAKNYHDGFNYHTLNTVLSRSIETDCIGRDNGIESGGANNGSSTHDAQSIVRVNGRYYRNNGPNIADVGGAESWLLGSVAYDSTGPATQNTNFHTEGEMWLDHCSSSGSTYDLRVVIAGSAMHIRSTASVASQLNDASTTVDSY